MLRASQNTWLTDAAVALAFWALMILRHGYVYGTGDHIEFLPYALKLAGHSLYPHDFFLDSLQAYLVNERIIFCGMLVPFVPVLGTFCFIAHILSTVLLLLGFMRIAALFVDNKLLQWGAVLLGHLVLYGHYPGNSGLHMNLFLPDLASHALSAWGIYHLLKRRPFPAFALMLAATLVHPLSGLYAGLPAALGFTGFILKQSNKSHTLLAAPAAYLAAAGVYFLLLRREPAPVLSEADYFNIFLHFRYPHHTLPSAQSALNMVLLLALLTVGLLYFRRRNSILYYYFIFNTVALGIYILGVEVFHSSVIGLSQWLRSSIFLMPLGSIALCGCLARFWKIQPPKTYFIVIACCVFSSYVFIKKTIDLRHNLSGVYLDDKRHAPHPEVTVSEHIRKAGLSGLFALPFNFNAFKFYSRQSSYVDWKASPRKNAVMAEWYRRVRVLYGLDTSLRRKGWAMMPLAEKYYASPDESRIRQLQKEGIRYYLVRGRLSARGITEVLRHGEYRVYRLD